MTLDELKRLLAESTPGPWEARAYDEDTDTTMLFFGEYDRGALYYAELPGPDARLISTLRNNAEKMIAVIEAAKKLADVAFEMSTTNVGEDGLIDQYGRLNAECAATCDALAALEGEKEQA